MNTFSRNRKAVLTGAFVLAGALAAGAGFWVQWRNTTPPAASLDASLGLLWETEFKDLSGKPVKLAAFKGRPLVVNFWATWCGPCVEEMPDFQRASRTGAGQRVQFVGIGIDYAKNMQSFADKLGISYLLLESGAQGLEIVKAAGNTSGALPFTLILDRSGKPVLRKLGKLEYAELMTAVDGL